MARHIAAERFHRHPQNPKLPALSSKTELRNRFNTVLSNLKPRAKLVALSSNPSSKSHQISTKRSAPNSKLLAVSSKIDLQKRCHTFARNSKLPVLSSTSELRNRFNTPELQIQKLRTLSSTDDLPHSKATVRLELSLLRKRRRFLIGGIFLFLFSLFFVAPRVFVVFAASLP